jgi:hypothetical protein
MPRNDESDTTVISRDLGSNQDVRTTEALRIHRNEDIFSLPISG